MEVTGLAVGVVGLAGLFSACLDSLSRFQNYRESNTDTHVSNTRFRAARARFEQWGVSVGISNGRLQPDHHRGLDNKERANLIESILEIIAKTICDESILQRSRTGPRLQSGQFGGLSQSRGKRLKWALGGKENRTEQVDVFEKLVQQLYNLISPEDKSQNFEGLESAAWVEGIRQMLTKIEDGIKSKRVETTCDWIFERPIFKSWLSPVDSTKPSVLWINGPAGFGKTVLSAHIVHHLSEALDTPVAHFFFTADHESREDPFSALRSWYRQITAKNDDAFECIHRTWENNSSENASKRVLVELLKEVVTAVPGCVLIADGLDECSSLGKGDSSVARFLRDVMGVIAGTDVRLLLVSRDEPEIREALAEGKDALLEYKIGTNDVEADTAAFSQSVVDRKLSGKSEDLRLAISEAMTERCQGQFLWIKLQEQSLRNTMSKKRLQEVVENTPSGLDHIYDQNWSRIMDMSDQDRDRTFALLRWTAFTLDPLSIYKVVEAVLIDQFEELDPDDYPEDVDDEYITGEILGLCGPLVEVHYDEEDPSPGYRTLHIPHFSVRQYLVQHLPAPIWMQPRDIINMEREMIHHTVIARACVQYLSLSQVWDEDDQPDNCLQDFLPYAASYWTYHAKFGFMDPSLRDLSTAFLNYNNTCFKSLVNYIVQGVDPSKSAFQPQLRPLEYVLYCGWIDMAHNLMENADVNEIGSLGRTPIFSACVSGSAKLVERFIQHDADLSITDVDGWTCLHLAAQHGFEDIVKILVESNVDLSPQNEYGLTPLHLAARGGHIQCCRYLLEQGADFNITDVHGGNIIHQTCLSAGHAGILRLILQNGPDTLATDHPSNMDTPLFTAMKTGDIDMVKVLLEFGAAHSLFVTSPRWSYPLNLAAFSGQTELVELFLEHGAERTLSVPDSKGNTALHNACVGTEHDKIIGLLLRLGVEGSLVIENEDGNTPLHLASQQGYASYVELILQYSQPVHQRLLEIQNKSLKTPLLIAAESTINILEFDNNSPLFVASAGGFSEIVMELLSHGAGSNIAAPNIDGETALHAAAFWDHVEVLKLLLEVPGVSVNQKTPCGFSPLFIASRNGNLSMVELLLSVDLVDKDTESWLGLSPLFAAVANGHLEVTRLLLSKGCHIQNQVSIGGDLNCPRRYRERLMQSSAQSIY
ncbi:ankyrin [Fusarium tjaetaba]|uniref:Ankyrin n=1 Tax=Fusarium tjaetaba TaxID=1567544 RepID=A0A8H5W1V9_9HYPO|nr:ankyrin [Fusarium tjaetaba]KAF5642273.1 ankyrin [Fusarium tjaetaba]